jgi:deoxyribonuclease V
VAYFRPPGPAPDPTLVRSLTEQQHALHQRLRPEPLAHEPRLIAGCDSSFPTPDTILSVFVVLEFPSLQLVEKVYNYGSVPLPYIPGLLSSARRPM